jgi:hypothetical protein
VITSILNALAAIPALLKAIQSLLGYFEKAEKERWFAQKTEAFQKLESATTIEEYQSASKAINDVLRGL